MQLKAGQSLVSAVCNTTVIVTRAPVGPSVLTCGGAAMVLKGTDVVAAEQDPLQSDGTLLGKRYVDADGTIELLCTKAGSGSLALDGIALATAAAKALPSSD